MLEACMTKDTLDFNYRLYQFISVKQMAFPGQTEGKDLGLIPAKQVSKHLFGMINFIT
jgi:hypothetical protein